MKLISWNVNGLRACEGKGFSDIFRELDADFFCLQETKMQQGQLDLQFPDYESYWNYAEKKGYSGTAIFTKHKPLNVTYGIGIDLHDHEGRVVTLEMDDFFLVCCYTPNSQDGLKRLEYRMSWEDAFRKYLIRLDQQKPVILCGDLNVAHEEIDLKNPKSNRMNAGFTDEEREKFSDLLACGFTDTFRAGHLFVVVLPFPGPPEERWLAHRLLRRQQPSAGSCRRFQDPHGDLWLRPLSCGTRPRLNHSKSKFRGTCLYLSWYKQTLIMVQRDPLFYCWLQPAILLP